MVASGSSRPAMTGQRPKAGVLGSVRGPSRLAFVITLVSLLIGGTMAFPTTTLSATVTIYFDGVTGTDVTQYVRDQAGLRRSAGRRGANSSADAGLVNFTLQAPRVTPGLFNPRDPSGTYWQETGWLGCQVVIVVEGTTWFTGRISRTSPYWDQDGDGYLDVEAAGPLRWIVLNKPSRAPLERSILAADPLAYWKLTDGSSAEFGGTVTPGQPGVDQVGTVTFAAVDGPVGAPDKLVEVASSATPGEPALTVTLTDDTTSSWTVETLWRALDAGSGATPIVLAWKTNGADSNWFIQAISSPGYPYELRLVGNGGVGLSVNPTGDSVNVFDGQWHQLRATITTSGGDVTAELFLDGTSVGSDTQTTTAGRITYLIVYTIGVASCSTASVGHIAVYSGDPASTAAALDGYAGEAAGTRFARICTEESITATVDSGTTTVMGPQPVADTLAILRECETVDLGRIGETAAGGIRYTPRRARYNATATLALNADDLSRSPRPVDQVASRIGDVEVSRPSGSLVRLVDQDVLDSGGTSTQKTLNLNSDSQLQRLAEWILGVGSVDEASIGTIELDFSSTNGSAHISDWLTAVAGGAVRVTVASWSGYPDGLDLFVEGFTERLSQVDWTASLVVSPARPNFVFVRGSSTYGRRAATRSTLAAGIDSDDTTLSVATSSGALWTTDDAQFPSDIVIGGERMTVTDISGASSPQTFTVTRSVNGVVKSHSSGASVRVWRPAVRAL